MIEQNLATLLMEIIPKTMRLLRAEMRGVADETTRDLNLSQFRMMAHLNNQPSSNRDLADRQGVSVATMSRNVDLMVKKGLLVRSASTVDRREIRLELSDFGRTEFQKIRKSAQFKFAQQISRLSSEQKDQLRQGFDALEALLKL